MAGKTKQVDEVWSMLDREHLASIVRQGPEGEIVSNLPVLNERFRLPQLDEIVARKRAGAEKMLLGNHELAEHAAMLDRLEATLRQAHDASHLPDEATSTAALDDFVVRLRLDPVRAGGKDVSG